ncbi:hypothetical protein COLO4_05887 [Corchorus olitorius]|uniref:Uncharacterized protein n=1 Tax=Corchorus olitorius TaxID=93759 RepID=A0A1R3KPJ6_9ROSI|nr:hypothetical protein COLO4_05887 [Corchorus olitorius]
MTSRTLGFSKLAIATTENMKRKKTPITNKKAI